MNKEEAIRHLEAARFMLLGKDNQPISDLYYAISEAIEALEAEPTLYDYPIEHLEMIARVMAKENCTPEIVAQMLQNAGEIAKMVRDEMMEMLKESVERTCKGEANDGDIVSDR